MNPISTSDILNVEEIKDGIQGLANLIQQAMEQAKKSVDDAVSSLKSVGSGGDTKALASQIEALNKQFKESQDRVKALESELAKLNNTTSGGGKPAPITLADAYQRLQEIMGDVVVNFKDLQLSEQELAKIQKYTDKATQAQAGSYNQLAAQYNALKVAINAMGGAMREAGVDADKLEKKALSLMNSMKKYQEATGKHTLSVGDYSKALNGLNLSTQQIVREMPTLANSLSQFFIAISNNVPIFVDNFQNMIKVTGSLEKAITGVISSLFSWQTILLVILTILPKVAKTIHDKKKAQDEDNKSTKVQVDLLHLVYDAMLAVVKAEVESIAKTRVLYSISQDLNRSYEDRIRAGNLLKYIYEDELKNFTAEEIAGGKAKEVIDAITISLQKQAKARALLNKITEAYTKQVDAEDKAIKAGNTRVYEYGFENVKGLYDYVQKLLETTNLTEKQIKKNIAFVAKGDKGVWKQYKEYKEARKEIEEYGKTIEDLTKRIDVGGLYDELLGSGKKRKGKTIKEELDEQQDYYWEWIEQRAGLIEDAETREVQLNEISYNQKIENYRKEFIELREQGKLTIEQEKYLMGIILGLEEEKQQKRREIVYKYYKDIAKAIIALNDVQVADEGTFEGEDLSISGRYEKVLATNAKLLIASRKRLNQELEDGTLKSAQREGNAFKKLTIEKLKLEEELQEELLKMRLDTGTITQDQYEIELANLQTTLAKSIANLARKKRRKFDIWTLLFGELKEDGKGNVYKELSDEAQAFTKSFESAMNMAFDYMNQWMDKRIEMADISVESAERETEAAKNLLDYEMEARANGYANNVEYAKREYDEKLRIEKNAVAERQRLQKIQEAVDTATQVSSLVTATANLWSSLSGIPIVGAILAAAATATMFGAFIAAKVQAAQVVGASYGEGMSEYLDYGGSHASGNDIDFGTMKDGRKRRVERGEVIGVINKRNVRKYGASEVQNIINSLNKGTFENKYGNSFADFSINGGVDISGISSDVRAIKEQGEQKVYVVGDKTIIQYRNLKRTIRND